jgi:peroxiredoxin Q/BCP
MGGTKMQTTRTPFSKIPALALTGVAAVVGTIPVLAGGGLTVGEAAPAFDLPGSDGESYRLEEFAGKRAVVVAWYPKAFTGG